MYLHSKSFFLEVYFLGKQIPKLKAGLDFLKIDDNSYTIVDSETGYVHYTDDIGMEIIHLIDGKLTIDKITEVLAVKFDAPSIEIFRDVEEYIKHLASAEMLTYK